MDQCCKKGTDDETNKFYDSWTFNDIPMNSSIQQSWKMQLAENALDVLKT